MKVDLNKNRCAKQITVAIVVKNGSYWIGTNSCDDPQKECPRKGMASGMGYGICKVECKQTGHAEENALLAAGSNARGAELILLGHNKFCDNCISLMKEAGIRNAYMGVEDYFFAKKVINKQLKEDSNGSRSMVLRVMEQIHRFIQRLYERSFQCVLGG